ncbi:MOB kinase activator 2, partial [Carlito syrichta]|uniref:MOB kinase activator 2 n=1 Tax=Carlito syrichta TaxID=1868482 RepID=A0A3Q0DMD5_CARSF
MELEASGRLLRLSVRITCSAKVAGELEVVLPAAQGSWALGAGPEMPRVGERLPARWMVRVSSRQDSTFGGVFYCTAACALLTLSDEPRGFLHSEARLGDARVSSRVPHVDADMYVSMEAWRGGLHTGGRALGSVAVVEVQGTRSCADEASRRQVRGESGAQPRLIQARRWSPSQRPGLRDEQGPQSSASSGPLITPDTDRGPYLSKATQVARQHRGGLPADQAVSSQSPRAGLRCKTALWAVSRVLRKSKAKPNGKRPAVEEKKAYLEPEHARSRIADFAFKELVVLPREIDLHEWLASNTTTFFHHINLQYSTISEFCTGETCQTMAVCNTQYYWYDERGKKVKCTAPQYVDFVMSSVQKLVTDEDVFPTKYGREFPSSFESLVKKICKFLFHVLGHIYWSHFKETLALELHGHLNTLYVHFILFAREFSLLDPKETAVMDDLTEVLC